MTEKQVNNNNNNNNNNIIIRRRKLKRARYKNGARGSVVG
jgi:hypothetical protein